MKYSIKLANKIRTKLLLFIDKEIRTKADNIYYLNEIKDNNSSICEIRTKEESFSSTQPYNTSDFNRNSVPELPLYKFSKFESRLTACSSSQFQFKDSIKETSISNDFYSKNRKHYFQNNKKQTNKILLKKIIKSKKEKSKDYLKNLCRNLINRSKSNKYYQSNSKILKKTKTYTKSPQKKRLKRYSGNKLLKQPSINVSSFKILLFACDY